MLSFLHRTSPATTTLLPSKTLNPFPSLSLISNPKKKLQIWTKSTLSPTQFALSLTWNPYLAPFASTIFATLTFPTPFPNSTKRSQITAWNPGRLPAPDHTESCRRRDPFFRRQKDDRSSVRFTSSSARCLPERRRLCSAASSLQSMVEGKEKKRKFKSNQIENRLAFLVSFSWKMVRKQERMHANYGRI